MVKGSWLDRPLQAFGPSQVGHTCSKTDLASRRDGPVSLTTITITTRTITISFTLT